MQGVASHLRKTAAANRFFKRKANLQREGLWLPDIFREFSDRLLYCFPQITHNVCWPVLGKNLESLHANG